MPAIQTPCPSCSTGHLILKQSRTGKAFYGCSNFPSCRFTSTLEPLPEPCPLCSSPYLTVKLVRKVRWAKCPSPGCSYARRLDPIDSVKN